MGVGQPRVKREERDLDGKRQSEGHEQPHLQVRGKLKLLEL
jgi:hypothetical protein